MATAILAAALAVRLAEVQSTSYRPVNDAGTYLALASQIANTGDYSHSHAPGIGAGGTQGPSAYFPPGYPYLLAGVELLDGRTSVQRVAGHTRIPAAAVHGARVAQAMLGTATVGLIGLLALEGLGPLVGLLAMGMAAVYPVLVGLSGTIVAENLLTPLVLVSLWAALRALRALHPYRWLAAAGALAGMAVLTHANAIVVAVPLLLLAWRVPDRPHVGRWRALAAPALTAACLVLVLVPWLVRNAIVMHQLVLVTDETGITLAGTYNAASAADPRVPYKWRLYYGIPQDQQLAAHAGRLTEPELSARLASQARRYVADHPLSPVEVTFDNSLRLLELEGSYAWHASAQAISLPAGLARLGVIAFWAMCALGLAGALTAMARRAWRWLWVTPALLWLSVAAVNAETPRFREPVDVFLIILGACALATASRWMAVRLGGAPVSGARVVTRPGGPSQRVEVG